MSEPEAKNETNGGVSSDDQKDIFHAGPMHHLFSVHVFQNTDAIKSILINQMDVHEEEPVIDTKPAVNLKEVGHR
jgi:hypothetical protein